MTADLYAAWLTAGNNLQPIGAWLGGHWIWLVASASAAATAWWAVRRWIRHCPAAADNVPPVDDELLTECRRISRQRWVVDSEKQRQANDYLRDKGEDNL